MKKTLSAFIITVAFISSSCRTLSSTTYIKAQDSFILGNNEHRSYSVKLKNVSDAEVQLWKAPIGGGQHSPVTVKPNETIKTNVDKNTALRIENKSNEQVAVELLVKGDTGLSMGYKNWFLNPYSTKTITDVVGTELFIANASRIHTVMSGKKIEGKAFWVFKTEDDGKTIHLR